jgi:hypothetical protein
VIAVIAVIARDRRDRKSKSERFIAYAMFLNHYFNLAFLAIPVLRFLRSSVFQCFGLSSSVLIRGEVF